MAQRQRETDAIRDVTNMLAIILPEQLNCEWLTILVISFPKSLLPDMYIYLCVYVCVCVCVCVCNASLTLEIKSLSFLGQ